MFSWFRELSQTERKGFYGAFLGHAVDVFDFMIYTFLIPTLLIQWSMSKSEAGAIVTYTLIASLVGAIVAGVLADRYGRVRVLKWTIVIFAGATFLSGFSNSPTQLAIFRAIQGLGFGGESSLCMVLVAEMIKNPAHRGKYSGFTASSYSFGWGAAALVFALVFSFVPAEMAWRICFFLGAAPALVVIYLRRNLQEPEIFSKSQAARSNAAWHANIKTVFTGPLLKKTILCSLLSGGMLGGYYAIATWLPTYLSSQRGLSIFGTSAYLGAMIFGSFLGYVCGSYATDRFGRRKTYIIFSLGALAMALSYMMIPISNASMLVLSFPLGMLMQGMFAGIGATISEAYPSAVRATGYGISYNVGRVIASLFPLTVGTLSTGTVDLGIAIAVVAGTGYAVVIIAASLLPETKGIRLDEVDAQSAVDDRAYTAQQARDNGAGTASTGRSV
ncbi:MAG: MFS transporter [Comamonas sp.]